MADPMLAGWINRARKDLYFMDPKYMMTGEEQTDRYGKTSDIYLPTAAINMRVIGSKVTKSGLTHTVEVRGTFIGYAPVPRTHAYSIVSTANVRRQLDSVYLQLCIEPVGKQRTRPELLEDMHTFHLALKAVDEHETSKRITDVWMATKPVTPGNWIVSEAEELAIARWKFVRLRPAAHSYLDKAYALLRFHSARITSNAGKISVWARMTSEMSGDQMTLLMLGPVQTAAIDAATDGDSSDPDADVSDVDPQSMQTD